MTEEQKIYIQNHAARLYAAIESTGYLLIKVEVKGDTVYTHVKPKTPPQHLEISFKITPDCALSVGSEVPLMSNAERIYYTYLDQYGVEHKNCVDNFSSIDDFFKWFKENHKKWNILSGTTDSTGYV
jgi:hypothetical protein